MSRGAASALAPRRTPRRRGQNGGAIACQAPPSAAALSLSLSLSLCLSFTLAPLSPRALPAALSSLDRPRISG